MPDSLSGSCLCGAVKYAIRGRIKNVVNCHCNTCKKITGAAFETLAFISEKSLEFLAGQEEMISFQISEMASKNFCGICGTPILVFHSKYPGNCMVQVGSLDNASLVTPATNVFCESMLPWVREIAELPSFTKGPLKKS